MSEIIPFKRPAAKPQDLVLRFLTSVGHKRDADFYLDLFASTRPESFAILVLDEEVLRDELDVVLFEIRYLMRLSLYPVVLIKSTNDFLEQLEIESYFKKAGMAQNFLLDDVTNEEKVEFIKRRMRDKLLPLLHLDPDLNEIAEVTQLAEMLKTGKVIYLRKQGGLQHLKQEKLVSLVNLSSDLEPLKAEGALNPDDLAMLNYCEQLVRKCDHRIFVSIVSPNSLLRELFTVKGAGTLIQRGSEIICSEKWQKVDPTSLKRLLESCFEKKLNPDFFNREIDSAFIEENYMGAAVVQIMDGIPYLTKFAVGTEARGLGIGRDLWNEISKHYKKFFWRSNPNDFITHWYTKQCDGLHKTNDWTVFWKGLEPTEISKAISIALEQPRDFS